MNSKNVQDLLKSGINKQILYFKDTSNDGLILLLQNCVQDSKNKTHTIRFINASFNAAGNILAAADQNGNIYLIDFVFHKAWCIQNFNPCTVLIFSTYHKNEIFVGANQGLIEIINIDNGESVGQLKGHKYSVHEISFANEIPLCISSSAYESIIWDLDKNIKLQVLSLNEENSLKHVFFIPVTNNILACFSDDTIYVWKYNTFESFKEITPKEWNKHSLKTISFTKNGRAMVLGGYSPNLYIFILDNWSFAKTTVLPNSIQAVKKLHFLSQPFDGGCNKNLCILASSGVLYFYDMEKSEIVNRLPTEDTITKFVCSEDGKRIACICSTGELKVYNSMNFIKETEVTKDAVDDCKRTSYNTSPIKPRNSVCSIKIQEQVNKLLELQNLKAILKEFGQYPDVFRNKIWAHILQIPNNKSQYNSFINYATQVRTGEQIDRRCTLEDKCMQKSLKRLMSNLVAWCPFLSSVDYLPQFIFPFLKIFNNDPLVCFEVVCTVIINWCQHWFEYFPLPPLNILALIENLLMEHDPELFNFFTKKEITSKVYAFPLLQSAFSEILISADWCKLWDHILTNEPAFVLMVVVAYNTLNRCVVAKFEDEHEFELFFRNPNPVDIKRLVCKSYCLLNTTLPHNHPRQFLRTFKSLDAGPYPVYLDYPKTLFELANSPVDLTEEEIKRKADEEELSRLQNQNDRDYVDSLTKRDEEIKRTEELQQLYYEKLKAENDRINKERENITQLRRSMSRQQRSYPNLTHAAILQNENKEWQNKIYSSLDDIIHNNTPLCNNMQMGETEQDLLSQYAELLKHKLKIEKLLSEDISNDLKTLTNEYDIVKQHQTELSKELQKISEMGNSTAHLKQLNLVTGLSAIDQLIKKITNELSKTASRHTTVKCLDGNNKVLKLDAETRELEIEIQRLLKKLNSVNITNSSSNNCTEGNNLFLKQYCLVNDGQIAPTNTPHF